MTTHKITNLDQWKLGVPKHRLLVLAGPLQIGVENAPNSLACSSLKAETTGKAALLGAMFCQLIKTTPKRFKQEFNSAVHKSRQGHRF